MKKSFYIGIFVLLICTIASFFPQILPSELSPTGLRMAGVTACISIFWLAETISIGASALMPLFLLPLLEIMPAKQVASSYGSNVILLFMTGFFVAKAIERWGLHYRISLAIIKSIGTSPQRLILGFMVATASLSAWISNTATCLMMLPIAIAAVEQFKLIENDSKRVKNFATCLMLGIAFAANIGGLSTPIASSSNIIFLANFNEFFPDRPTITFLQWIIISLPLVVVFLGVTWFYLVNFSRVKISLSYRDRSFSTSYYLEKETEENNVAIATISVPVAKRCAIEPNVIDRELARLGNMTRGEKYVALLFMILALLWIFRSDLIVGSLAIPGWSNLLGLSDFVKNTTVAAAIAFIMFVIPIKSKEGKSTTLLSWEQANTIPWDILLLFGAGVAISKGFTESGLSDFLTNNLSFVLQKTPLFITILLVAIFTAILTEFASNTAVSLLLMPICASLAPALGIDPLILMWTATKALKCTFCLPVATPPNAIVYSQKYFDIATMTRVGIPLNFLGIILIILTINFLAVPVLK